jgi:hypothetical protein
MFLLSVLLAAITFNPAMAPAAQVAPLQGEIEARPIAQDSTCKPGAICASYTFNREGCFFNNVWVKGVKGGTPLTIDVTETGSGKPVYIYWINTLSTSISITGAAHAHYYCVVSS